MMNTDLTDLDYRSDECDEQTAQELYISAFFHEFSSENVAKTEDIPEPSKENTVLPSVDLTEKRVIRKTASVKKANEVKLINSKLKPLRIPQVNSLMLNVTKVGGEQLSLEDVEVVIDSEGDEGLAAKYSKKVKKKRKKVTKVVEEDVDEVDPRQTTPGWSVQLRRQQLHKDADSSMGREGFHAKGNDAATINLNKDHPTESVRNQGIPLTTKAKKWRYHEPSQQDVWHINAEDRFDNNSYNRRYRFRNELECSNCRQPGHTKYRCPLPFRNICFCCGESHRATKCKHLACSICKLAGHLSGQCPLAIQLVGIKCRECNNYGHGRHSKLGSVCPDLWRRYHRTTREGPPVVPARQTPSVPQRVFCTSCGLKGHSAVDCGSWRDDLPRPSRRDIVDYERPPKSFHKQSQWPVGNRIAIPFRQGGRDYGGKFSQNAEVGGGIRDMPSSRKAKKRSWEETLDKVTRRRSQGHIEDEFEESINRRKKRRRIAKILKRAEFSNTALMNRGNGVKVKNGQKPRKWR